MIGSTSDFTTYCRGRYYKKNGERYPIWCEDPANCLRRGMIPTQLFKPIDIQQEIDQWIEQATAGMEPEDDIKEFKRFHEFKKKLSDRIKDIRSVIKNYNLPYLTLPSHYDKTVALNVFINMNTNSKPLSTYDIIVAEIEDVKGVSLHDMQSELRDKYPDVDRYEDLSELILNTSALLQNQYPNQRGAWQMDKHKVVENWGIMGKGLSRMSTFLKGEGVFDKERLPTNAVLAVIAALYSDIPESGDKRGQDEQLLKRYLWRAFFTDRYENSAASNAFADYQALRSVIRLDKKDDGNVYTPNDVPILRHYELATPDELLVAEWPKRMTIRGRGILAVACKAGAFDFSTGEQISPSNIKDRHYHHIFPDALLKEANIENSFIALNCAIIADKTNISIGRKDPLEYLKDRYKWSDERIVKERLHSHVIPIKELANGGYEGMSKEDKIIKIKNDYEIFIKKRAELVYKAVCLYEQGLQFSPASLFDE